MLSMDCGVDTVITKKRYPNKTTMYAKITCKAFGDLRIKKLSQPALTYHYNININRVNKKDQIRASYPI